MLPLCTYASPEKKKLYRNTRMLYLELKIVYLFYNERSGGRDLYFITQ